MKHNCLIVAGLTIALSRALLTWRILYETHHLFLTFIFPFLGLAWVAYPQKKEVPRDFSPGTTFFYSRA